MNTSKFGFQVLTDEEVHEIHVASLDLLHRCGMAVHEAKGLKLLRDAGAEVDFDKRIAKLPPRLVEDGIKKAPREFILGGRTTDHDVHVGHGKAAFRVPAGPTYFIDKESGTWREATKKDLEDSARLLNALNEIDYTGCMILPSDAPPETRDIHATEVLLENTEKHVTTVPFTSRSLNSLVRFSKLLSKDESDRRNRPRLSVFVAPTSPLQLSEEATKLLIGCAENGIPINMVSMAVPGGTTPATLAGSLMLSHAEMMTGILMAQIVQPGLPIVYGSRVTPLNPRSGVTTLGAIEVGLASAALARIGHHVGLPVDSHGLNTDSKVLDQQSGFERSLNAVIPLLAGADIISGCGEIESHLTLSLEQLVIDNEIIGMMRRVMRGIEVSAETLASDVIARIGPGGYFLPEKHTREHFRKEYFIPSIIERDSRTMWAKMGSTDIVKRARDKAKGILEKQEAPPYDKDTICGLRQVVDDAQEANCT